jgi:hypothetical protein
MLISQPLDVLCLAKIFEGFSQAMSSRSFDIRFFYFFNSIINKLISFYKKNFDKNIKKYKNLIKGSLFCLTKLIVSKC